LKQAAFALNRDIGRESRMSDEAQAFVDKIDIWKKEMTGTSFIQTNSKEGISSKLEDSFKHL
jgi:hypothetical protein